MTESKEAAKTYCDNVRNATGRDSDPVNAFQAGAQWQAEQSPWISVGERLPEDGDDLYIVLDTTMNPLGVGLCGFDVPSKTWVDNYHLVVNPTHWMEIPELPKE